MLREIITTKTLLYGNGVHEQRMQINRFPETEYLSM